MNDFLNAKSMVTPGVAGGLVMLITNAFANNFGLVPKWTALVVSALLALFVVCILTAPLWQKGLLWFFNALVIFSMAMGTNQAGATLQNHPETRSAKGPYPTPAATPVITPAPLASASPAPTPRKIDPKVFDAARKSQGFFRPW